MCEFVSWIEYKDDVWFLTNDCLRTKEGKALKRYLGNQFVDDIKGHGAIRRYYGIPENKGVSRECTNFSNPNNFPEKVREAIKNGSFSKICGPNLPVAILTQPAWAEYQKVEQAALAEYQKVEQPALAEYQKVKQAAWAEYQKVKQAAWAEYQKVEQAALAEYQKVKQPAWAEYQKVEQAAFWKIAVNPRNRVKEWR
jgi:hypothetical protein